MWRNILLASLAVLAAAALVAVEVRGALGDGAVDRDTVREPVHLVVVDAEDGDVELRPAGRDVTVAVERHHVINTPATSQRVEDGVLTLRTTCTLGFVGCRTDYRLGVPEGVDVEVRKASGQVEATAVGGGVIEVAEASAPVRVRTDAGALTVARR